MKGETRNHLICLSVLLVLTLVFLHSILGSNQILNNIHYINDVTFVSYNIKEAMLTHHSLPLWTPYYYSGQPLFAQPEYPFMDLNVLFILLFRNIFLAMNLTVISYFFLAGMGMYFLFWQFRKSHAASLLAAIVFMFNGFTHGFVIPGNVMVLQSYSLIPFVLLFLVKALQEEKPMLYSILAGSFVAMQIWLGGAIFLPYELILIAVYAGVFLIGGNIGKNLKKILLTGVVLAIVALGLGAIKLLPGAEFVNLSNRGAGISYEEYLGHPVQLKDFGYTLITNLLPRGSSLSVAVGIAGFVLVLFALKEWKKKYVLFSAAAFLLSILLALETPLARWLYSLPIFGQLRHIERALVMAAVVMPILIGIGFLQLQEKIKKEPLKKAIPFIAIGLVLIELLVLYPFPASTPITKPQDVPIISKIAEDQTTFRTINLALSTLVGAEGYNYMAQENIGTIKGGSGIWFNDYLAYLSIAQNTQPAKLWGILNNKYVISKDPINHSDFKFVSKFEGCDNCNLWEAWGPYLYENIQFMPRAYRIPNAVLVVGDEENRKNTIYALLINSVNPKKAVLVEGEEDISGYTPEKLKKFRAVILASGSLNAQSGKLIEDYANQGGIVLPDVLRGEPSITPEKVNALFNVLEGELTEMPFKEYSPNNVQLEWNGDTDFLVLSERFSNFPGWKAEINNKEMDIEKANGIITAVYPGNEKGTITFSYHPSSFRNGKWITFITLIGIIGFLGYSNQRKRTRQEPPVSDRWHEH